jgi:uncharacterized membrane protein
MHSAFVLLLTFGIGVVAGLRSATAPAVVAWAAHLGWINLAGSRLSFMESDWAVGILTILAMFEFIADQLPGTPDRTAPVGLTARIVAGLLCGACLGIAGGVSLWLGAIVAALGALAGTFGGFHARRGLVKALHAPDIAIAIPEDVIAVGLGFLLVTRF